MREYAGQASGLQHFMAPRPTRLVAVAALDTGTAAFQLLWLLTRQPAGQDTPTLVLDGQAHEAAGEGLAAALQRPGTDLLSCASADGLPTVLPAREGLLQLCEQARTGGAATARRQLLRTLPAGALVLLNAPPEMLAMLLMDSDVHPLVALDAGPRAVVSAYNALKLLLHAGGVRPVLVPLQVAARSPELRRAEQAVLRCCLEHLGEAVQSWPVAYHDDHVAGHAPVPESWWLRVLDTALAQEAVGPALGAGWQRPGPAREVAFRSP